MLTVFMKNLDSIISFHVKFSVNEMIFLSITISKN